MGSLLLLLLALAIIGYPARLLLARLTPVIRDLDLLQRFTLNVYCGGLVLYVVALLPFRAFTDLTAVVLVISFALISAFIVCLHHLNLISNPAEWPNHIRTNARRNTSLYLGYLATAGLFLLILWIVLEPTDHYIFGSIHDTSLHSLFTQVIIENGHIPETLAPYEPSGILHPVGGHPIFAFATYLFDWSSPYAVFRVTPLFIALLVLGGYFLGKCINGRTSFGVLLATTLSLVASHPVYMTWGGNTFALAYPLLLMCLGLLVLLLRSEKRTGVWEFLPLFPLFGYLMALHGSVFLTFVIAGGICCLANGFVTRSPFNKLFVFALTALAGLVLVAPFLWRFFAWRTEPGHNIGLPADVGSEWFIPHSTLIPPLEWITEQVSPYNIVQGVICLLLVLGILTIVVRWREQRALILVLAFSIGLTPLFLTWLATRAFWVDQVMGATTATIGYVALGLVSAVSLETLYRSRWITSRLSSMRRPLFGLLVVALVLSPCVYYRVCEDPQLIRDNYRFYAVTADDDLQLMEWMRDSNNELGEEAVVLTNAFEPGMFIPSLTRIKTVFPYTGSQYSISYQQLVAALHEGRLGTDAYDIMGQFGITHVYVGSKASWWPGRDFKWDPRLFLDNPNFNLIKSFGEAYLFRFVYTDADLVFSDDFEYADLDLGGWSLYNFSEVYGNERDAASIESEAASNGESGVRIESQKNSGNFYWTSMWKEVYLGEDDDNASHYYLSFNLRAMSGFGPHDDLILAVSDENWNRQLYLETAGTPSYYLKPEWQVCLSGASQPQLVDLSQLWLNTHGSSLPSSFHIQVINLDADGITNVGYFDYVTISRHSGTQPPTVASISPSHGAQGDIIDVTITGTNFTSDAVPSCGPGTTVTSFVVDSPTQITVTLLIDVTAVLGVMDIPVTVTTSNGEDTSFSSLLVVTAQYGVTWNSVDTSTVMNAGETYSALVGLTNTSNFTWLADGANLVHLAYHWYTSTGELIEWDGQRSVISSDLAPGQNDTVIANVTAPSTPGSYILKWDIVQEGIAWFSLAGCTTLDVSAEVTA